MRESEQKSRAFAKQLRRTMTRAEALLWSYIRRKAINGAKFRRQHPIGPYIADFACVSAKLVVEIDGYTHWTEEQLRHDERRTAFLRSRGWRTVRVTNTEVYDNLDGVWDAIAYHLPPPLASLGPPPLAGEE